MAVDDGTLQDLIFIEDLIANAKQIAKEAERNLMVLRSRVADMTDQIHQLKDNEIISVEEYRFLKSQRKANLQLCKAAEVEVKAYKERLRNLQIEYGKLNAKIQKELKKETNSCGKVIKIK
jgi:hypothetical protein